MSRVARRAGPRPGALARAAALGLAALAGVAWIPDTAKIANAFSKENREAGRAHTIELQVELRFEGDADVAATGALASTPDGATRLELVSQQGFIERHLVRGRRVEATRDGIALADARTFLPPYYLTQTESSAILAGWLRALGADPGRVDLGHEGDSDCYVFGGRDPSGRGRVSLWIDQDALRAVRFDREDGAVFRYGPELDLGGLRVPGWIAIEAPGEPPARLVVLGGGPAEIPAEGFAPAWLLRARPNRP